jgi:hypothetical protein
MNQMLRSRALQLIAKHKLRSPADKKWVSDIRIGHLLTHTCGGWDNTGGTATRRQDPGPMLRKLAEQAHRRECGN